MDQITFEVNGFAELYKKFKQLDEKAKGQIKDEFNASALKIQSTAKRLAPVNFGQLRNSIVLSEDGKGSDFIFSIKATAKYAPYVEFGTGGKVSVPADYTEYAARFKGKSGGTFKEMIEAIMLWVQRKGISGKNDRSTAYLIARSILRKGLRPQPFLIPAFEQEKPKLIKRIKEILNA
jgi:HK97 gp10 family phage protein